MVDNIKKAYGRMTKEDLEKTERRASSRLEEALDRTDEGLGSLENHENLDSGELLDVGSDLQGAERKAENAREELNNIEKDRRFREAASSIQAMEDLERYMHGSGFSEDRVDGMVGTPYEVVLQENLESGDSFNTVQPLISALIRDREGLSIEEASNVSEVSESAVIDARMALGLPDFRSDDRDRNLSRLETEYSDEIEIIKDYVEKVPGARPGEMAAVVAVENAPDWLDVENNYDDLVQQAASHYDRMGVEDLERARIFYEEATSADEDAV